MLNTLEKFIEPFTHQFCSSISWAASFLVIQLGNGTQTRSCFEEGGGVN